MIFPSCLIVAALLIANPVSALSSTKETGTFSRRGALGWFAIGIAVPAFAEEERTDIRAEGMDINNFMKTGTVSQPMGVSGQAGKSRPETGVILRQGSDVSRNEKSGDVLAEIVVKGVGKEPIMAVLARYVSPWPLAKGSVFDVECRDSRTGDAAFLQVTNDVNGATINNLKDSFFLNELLSPTGRFSFYGPPTDVKLISSRQEGDYRIMDISFSTISQATQSEIPRKARLVATIPNGASQAVMLIASASALRWKKGSSTTIASVASSFRAIPAPLSSLKLRGKERGRNLEMY